MEPLLAASPGEASSEPPMETDNDEVPPTETWMPLAIVCAPSSRLADKKLGGPMSRRGNGDAVGVATVVVVVAGAAGAGAAIM